MVERTRRNAPDETLLVVIEWKEGKEVANILVRGLSDETKQNLMIYAASLGISMNELCLLTLDEIAMPFSDLRKQVQDRAMDAIADRQREYERIPRPRHHTQPFKAPTTPDTPQGAIILRDPNSTRRR